MPAATIKPIRNIQITKCRPVWLTTTEQGFHIYGTFSDGSPLLPQDFSFAADDVGNPLLKRWWPDHAAWSDDDRQAVLAAAEQAIIAD